jgi:hypothetical protein
MAGSDPVPIAMIANSAYHRQRGSGGVLTMGPKGPAR